jgi:hypothetical protein
MAALRWRRSAVQVVGLEEVPDVTTSVNFQHKRSHHLQPTADSRQQSERVDVHFSTFLRFAWSQSHFIRNYTIPSLTLI